jgi:hypothetical protein
MVMQHRWLFLELVDYNDVANKKAEEHKEKRELEGKRKSWQKRN